MFAKIWLMTLIRVLARSKQVLRAAIRALDFAVFAYIEEDARMAAPRLHAGLFARAEDAALGIQISGRQFNRFVHRVAFKPW